MHSDQESGRRVDHWLPSNRTIAKAGLLLLAVYTVALFAESLIFLTISIALVIVYTLVLLYRIEKWYP